MGKKKDLYIDYKHSNKKRGKQGRNKYWITMLIIMVICIGLSAYFIVLSKENWNNRSRNQSVMVTPTSKLTYQQVVREPTTHPEITKEPVAGITSKIKQAASPYASVTPTTQPAKAVANDSYIENETKGSKLSKAIKGIYVPARTAGSDKINNLINMTDNTEINAMVIDIKDDHGRISYAIDCDQVNKIGAATDTIPDIKALVKKLKKKNIYLIGRIVAFKDPYLAKKRTDLAIKNSDGTLYKDSNGECWVNPYNKKVWNYLVDIATQTALEGFDEIQFDYIRFSTSKGISKANLGNEAVDKSKETIITEFTKYAYGKLKPLKVAVSADVYGTIIASDVDAKLVGQNFVEMSKYLDYICPMIYPSHFGEGNFGIQYPDQEPFKIISKVLSISASKLKDIPKKQHRAVVRPWLQDFTASWIKHHIDYGGEEIREEIEGVYSVGYEQWLLWNSSCNYSKNGLLKN